MKIMNKKRVALTSLLFFFIALGTTAIWTEKSFSGKPVGSGPENPASIANMVVVAKSAGDFDSIQAAIDSITPTVNSPYLIKVMPGTYTENIDFNKSNVHLQGSGRDVTKIEALVTTDPVIIFNGNSNVAISNFTIQNGDKGIHNIDSSPMIVENKFSDNYYGIYNESSDSAQIEQNIFELTFNQSEGITNFSSSPTITGNMFNYIASTAFGVINNNSSPMVSKNRFIGSALDRCEFGILNTNASSPTISGNTISGMGCIGIYNISSSPRIIGNSITGDGEGIHEDSSSSSIISGNVIQDVGYTGISGCTPDTIIINNKIHTRRVTDSDIRVSANCNINFNTFDTYDGFTPSSLNVKSDGSPHGTP